LAAAPLYAAVSLGGPVAGKGAAVVAPGASGRTTPIASKAAQRKTAQTQAAAPAGLSGAGATAAASPRLSALTPSRQRALQLVLAHSAAKHEQAVPAPDTTAEATSLATAGVVRQGSGSAVAGLATAGGGPPTKGSALLPGVPFQPQVLSPSFRLSPSSFDSPSTAGRASSSSAGTSALLSSSSLLASPPPFPPLTGVGVDTTASSSDVPLLPRGGLDGSLHLQRQQRQQHGPQHRPQHTREGGSGEEDAEEEEEEDGSAAAMLELLRGRRTANAAQWLDDSLEDAGGGAESAGGLHGVGQGQGKGQGQGSTGGSGSGVSVPDAALSTAAPRPQAPRPAYTQQPPHSALVAAHGGRSEASVAAFALDAYLREAASEGGSDDSDEEGGSDAPQRAGAGHLTGAAPESAAGAADASSLLNGGRGTAGRAQEGAATRQHGSPETIAAISSAALQQLRQLRFRTEAVVGGGGFAVPAAAARGAPGSGLPPPSRHSR
jgi:hypothetical protein